MFPFVKLFPEEGLKTFEIYLTFSSHWLQPLHASFPSLPHEILQLFESVLKFEDPGLLHIIRQTSLITRLYDSLLSQFTDLLSRECWLQIFDFFFCFSEYPELYLLVVPALLIIFKSDIVSFANQNDLPMELIQDPPNVLENIQDAEDLLQDQRLESLTQQINFTTKVQNHTLTSDFRISLSHFTEAFLLKLRLVSGTRIVKQLHILLRQCYEQDLFCFKYSPSSNRPSTDLHYPIFALTSRLII